ETNIRIDEISDFSNPQFVFCYKGSAPADSIPEPEPEPEELENIIIYNSFSPNGDGFNDTWIIDNCPNCNVKVYNRNGNIVFSSDDNSISWDGKYNNKKVPDATYYYIISPSNSTEIIKGSVTIIR
ncbi:MAG: gliding motility-associated C-terminal domain-containing protein, partial [Bacteroidales bacterium]|nr:gliding motility-associated C-terminal domain-containing protein [Bacteroidales bacterium]